MIASLADLNRAYSDGRWHMQRFTKNAGSAHALQWADPTFSSGQPAYDAHVGAALAFTPAVAQKNDSIWFPGIGADQHRYLHSLTMQSNQNVFNGAGSVVLFDLLGYYPLIDGDSTDTQVMSNALTLPRYTDGEGVGLVLVNHVAPATAAGIAVLGYTDSDGIARTHTASVPWNGQNMICSGVRSTASNDTGPVTVSLANGTKGVRSLDSLTYTVPPGGLHCAYLVKILGTMTLGDNLVAAEKDFYLQHGGRMPRIHDGAWLGWFDRIGSGTARTVAWFGNYTFVWG